MGRASSQPGLVAALSEPAAEADGRERLPLAVDQPCLQARGASCRALAEPVFRPSHQACFAKKDGYAGTWLKPARVSIFFSSTRCRTVYTHLVAQAGRRRVRDLGRNAGCANFPTRSPPLAVSRTGRRRAVEYGFPAMLDADIVEDKKVHCGAIDLPKSPDRAGEPGEMLQGEDRSSPSA
jgi:hypothetical protein